MNFMSHENQTIHELILEAREQNLKILNFLETKDALIDIPDELYELTELEELHLRNGFSISKISNKIKNLKNLKELTICNAEFTRFPLELIEMDSLTNLIIESPKLTELPTELSKWEKLGYLNLRNCSHLNQIIGLPPKLHYIYLQGDSFTDFPTKVFELNALTKIVTRCFKLKNIPEELFNLNDLRALFIGNSTLTSLPREILKLKNLMQLWLDDNLFLEFPEIITQIAGLEELNLSRNLLTKISPNITRLKNLWYLNLGQNCFTEIPDKIFELSNLKELNFGNFYPSQLESQKNIIRTISSKILNLKNLTELELYLNPVENVPNEILEKGIESIKNFILSKLEADNEEFLYEAKMVIVGRGDVGKTVLTNKLTDPRYSLSESKSTKGINILKNPFEFKMDGLLNTNSFRFNIWDFGGQEKYDATHQLFITRRSIYLFLTEARDESNYQDVYYWLNTISLFSYNSPVIIVLSKYDERKKLIPHSIYQESFKNIVQFVDVSCADGYEYTITNLKAAIEESVKLLPQIKLTLSSHWVDIRNELEQLSHQYDYIDYDDYLKICERNKLDKSRADFLSEFLNDLGVIIHHKNDLLLRKTIILNTDWCVDGMYKVLDDESVFQNHGRFYNQDLQKIWNEKRFENKQPELIKLMCDYNLCFELSDGEGYIAPDLLPPDKPKSFNWEIKSSLQFEYQYTFMPAGMLGRFIVKSHSFIKKDLYWKYGVILVYDNTEALVEEDYMQSKIKVYLKGENKKGLLSAIRMFIEEIHKDFDKSNKLVFEEMIPCNCSDCISKVDPHFYKFNVLKRFEQKSIREIHCEKSSETVNIKNLINDVQVTNPIDYYETNDNLKVFILEILENVLFKEINLKGGYTNFWRDRQCSKPKDEEEFHPYICNTLDNYCKVRGINLAREVKEANGNVDILFSCTNNAKQVLKVSLEVKKAHHQDIENAIVTQLPIYMQSAGTKSGIYLVIWFKNEFFKQPAKFNSENELKIALEKQNANPANIDIRIISCCKNIAPSRIKVNK
jgi:internalin A